MGAEGPGDKGKVMPKLMAQLRGRVTALLLVIINDGLKFISGEPELLLQCRPVSGQDIDHFQLEMIFWVLQEAELFPLHYVLDDGVHQQSAANNSHLFTG
ncbi:hypothetical protein ES707_05331 [subsurface metagenome]